MFNSKTYFAQVPLEIVKKIVAAQIQTEAANEPAQAIDKETPIEAPSEVEEQSIAQNFVLAQEELLN